MQTLQSSATINSTNKAQSNRLRFEDRAAHDWYRFVLSFPPHLVREYLERFEAHFESRVLDPFCGTGTTLVECKKLGIPCAGLEANPMAYFATQVKTDWIPDPDDLLSHSQFIAAEATVVLAKQGIEDYVIFAAPQDEAKPDELKTLPEDIAQLLLTDSISPLPLHKTLVLLECIRKHRDNRYIGHQLLALARALVGPIGNLHFGPEVGVGKPKRDAPVLSDWLSGIRVMCDDLRSLREKGIAPAKVYQADARCISETLSPRSIDIVITSPPYPNEKDYTRTTRLESVLLGFIRSKNDLRSLKYALVRSNTRGVYKADTDDEWVSEHAEIQRIAKAIEDRRIELGKTSGFERLYGRVAKLYFGGMARHLSSLRGVLRPGAQLAYVVGDQASYLRVMIRTGELLADVAQSLGYEVVGLDLFRTRIATATKEQLREEILVLRWPGRKIS